MKNAGLIIAKGHSGRIPNKNTKDFLGKPMIVWNLEKMRRIFDKVYVSSDSDRILEIAEEQKAVPIKRGKELCGETPNIPVYKHAIERMKPKPDYFVAVQANTPTLPLEVMAKAKFIMDSGYFQELMTCIPDEKASKFANKGTKHAKYTNSHYKWCSNIWAMTAERLESYGDPYEKTPEVLIKDDSIDIHNMSEFKLALKQQKERKGCPL